jgi:hypothetical protein
VTIVGDRTVQAHGVGELRGVSRLVVGDGVLTQHDAPERQPTGAPFTAARWG